MRRNSMRPSPSFDATTTEAMEGKIEVDGERKQDRLVRDDVGLEKEDTRRDGG